MSKPGHNSKVKAGPVAGERLKSFVERIEKMEEERKAIAGDIRDIYAEAKGVGYDVKTVRWVVQERRLDAADRAERDTLRDVYQHALDTAVGLVRGGLSLREAGRITGSSKSSIHRALAVPSVSQPEDGDDGITVPTGGPVAVRSEGGSHDAGHLSNSRRHQTSEDETVDESLAAGVAAQADGDDHGVRPRGVLTPEPEVARVAPPASDDDLAIPHFLRGSRMGRGA